MQLVCGNSTITDEALSFILFLPLSKIYCSPTLPGPGALGRPLARWWQMWYDKGQKGAAQCLCRSKKGGARRNAAPAENRGLLYGTI